MQFAVSLCLIVACLNTGCFSAAGCKCVCQAAVCQLVFNFCRNYGKIGPQKGGKEGILPATTAGEMPSIALPFKWWKPEFISTFQFVLAPPLACPLSHVDAPDGLKAPTSRELTCAPPRRAGCWGGSHPVPRGGHRKSKLSPGSSVPV